MRIVYFVVTLTLLSCEKECFNESNLGEFQGFLPYDCSTQIGDQYILANEDSSIVHEIYCTNQFDSIRQHDCDDCICEEIVRVQIFMDEFDAEIFRIEYQAFKQPGNLILRLNEYAIGWTWWTAEVWEDLRSHPNYIDSVEVNRVTYYNVIETLFLKRNGNERDTISHAYLNMEQGIVAYRDTSDIWWNIVKK